MATHRYRQAQFERYSSRVLVALSDACDAQGLTRLGALVDGLLFERQAALPPRVCDPALEAELPF
ncbi:hypothetical protein [Vulcanococcus limneticus]|uniref:hypothetical protein n=1 Tax=Vulcanococcus limneticus TaxID=2170428 RepID=UPI00398BF622